MFQKPSNALISHAKSIPYFILSFFITVFLGVKKNRIIFCSNTGEGMTGNAKYLYEYMNDDPEFDCYYLFKSKKIYEHYKKNYPSAIYVYSLQGLYVASRARVFIVTHGLDIPLPTFNKICIQTWHGIPIKPLGFLRNFSLRRKIRNFLYKYLDYNWATYYLSSSRYVSLLFSGVFSQPLEKFIEVGFPRDDQLLTSDRKALTENLIASLGLDSSARFILYTPTWREYSSRYFDFPGFPPGKIAELKELLEANNLYILAKSHRNTPFTLPDALKMDRIIDVDLNRVDDVQELLCASDYLITDYSSICFDALLLDMQMIFIDSDRELYEKTNSKFCCDYDLMTTGPKVSRFEDFVDSLTGVVRGEDHYAEQRKFVSQLLRREPDKLSAPRAKDFIASVI